MIELTHPDLPLTPEIRSPSPTIAITSNEGDVFSIDPLAKLRQVSNPFSIPVIPNPPYVGKGYLYRIPKTSVETIALSSVRDWWQTEQYFYAIAKERQTIVYELDSDTYTFPAYGASSYGFRLTGLLEDSTIVSLTVGGSRYTIGANLVQTGNTLTFTPQESVRYGSRITIHATATKTTDPYAIVHTMDFSNTALREVAEIQHLAFTYTRSLSLDFQLYQFRWVPQVADLFLPMNWEYTIAQPPGRVDTIGKTIGIVNFNG
jgi:hypothetical protein